MLVSEEYPMKAHKNQWLLIMPSPPAIPGGGTNQGTHHGVWRADAFAVTWDETIHSDVGLQTLDNKALSRGIIGKSTPILAEITIRKSQSPSKHASLVDESSPFFGSDASNNRRIFINSNISVCFR